MTYRLRVSGHDELVNALDSMGGAASVGPSPIGIWRAEGRIWLPPTPLDEVEIFVERSEPPTAATSAPVATAGRAPSSVRDQCLLYMGEELGVPVSEDTDFFSAGGESVGLVDIVGRLTAEHNFVADFERLDGMSIAGVIATEVERQAAADRPSGGAPKRPLSRPSIRHRIRPLEPGVLAPAGGGANFCYAALNRLCPTVGFHTFRAVLQDGPATIEGIAAPTSGHCRTGAPSRIN